MDFYVKIHLNHIQTKSAAIFFLLSNFILTNWLILNVVLFTFRFGFKLFFLIFFCFKWWNSLYVKWKPIWPLDFCCFCLVCCLRLRAYEVYIIRFGYGVDTECVFWRWNEIKRTLIYILFLRFVLYMRENNIMYVIFLALRGEATLASYYPVDSSSQNEYGRRNVVAEKCWSLL